MTDMLLEYGLFLAETLTVVVGIGVLIALIATLARRESSAEHLEVRCINRAFEDLGRSVRHEVLPAKQFKAEEKARKKKEKARAKTGPHADRKRVFVLNFRGDIKASAVASLRHEITAVLRTAKRGDEVLLRLENAGAWCTNTASPHRSCCVCVSGPSPSPSPSTRSRRAVAT